MIRFLLIFAIVIIVHMFVFLSGQPSLEKAQRYIDQLLAEGHAPAPAASYSQLLAKKILIDRLKPDCIFIGASRSVTIDPAQIAYFRNCQRPFNGALIGSNFNSHVLLLSSGLESGMEKVMIQFNPIEALYSRYRFGEAQVYKSLFASTVRPGLFGRNILNWIRIHINDFFHLRHYHAVAKNFLPEKIVNLIPRKKILDFTVDMDLEPKMKKNGVLDYPRSVRAPSPIGRQKFLNNVETQVNEQKFDVTVNTWCRIFEKLRAHGVEIELVDFSVHKPSLKNFQIKMRGLVENTCNIKLKLVDPHLYCSDHEFIDPFHFEPSCAQKIAEHI